MCLLNKNQKQWDSHSDLYSYFINELTEKKGNTDNILPKVLKLIGNIDNKKLLDYGCGEGRLSRVLYDLGAIVYAYDISMNMIKISKKKNNKRKIIYTSDFNSKNVFKKDFYDFVLCFMVLIAIKKDEIDKNLEMIYSVLEKDGHAIFINTNPKAIGHEFKDFFSEIKEENKKDGYPYKTYFRTSKGTFEIVDYYYSNNYLKDLYQKSGFKVIHEKIIEEQFLLHIVKKEFNREI